MEIAVAANSPLGRYLAEVDAENDGASAAQLLTDTRTPRTKRPTCQKPKSTRRWSFGQLIALLHRRLELVAVQRLIPQLCDFHPTIWEELQQEIGHTGAEMLKRLQDDTRGRLWKRRVLLLERLDGVEIATNELRGSVVVFGGVVVLFVAVAAADLGGGYMLPVQAVGWVVTLASVILLSLEWSMRLLLAWYAHRSSLLVVSLKSFVDVLEKFNRVYGESLKLVKRVELASRGYRLGAGLLPPIGRLEGTNAETEAVDGSEENVTGITTKQKLRCLLLRRRLRQLGDQLQQRAFTLTRGRDEKQTGLVFHDTAQVSSVDEQAPSLLLTALMKQRNRAVLLLDSAVHTVLVRSMVSACSSRDNYTGNLFHLLGSQRLGIEELVEALGGWTSELEAWNTAGNPKSLPSSSSGVKSSERQQSAQRVVSFDGDHAHLKNVATHLQELRSTSETLNALVIAAQHELFPAESAAGRLASSHEAMTSMVQQQQDAWSSYDDAVRAIAVGENSSRHSEPGEVEQINEHELNLRSRSLPSASVPVAEDPTYTFVFTGTSTGDEGFDLKALLAQQTADSTSSAATPHFVRELRDVLAHRQAHTQPSLTKQVDHDPPVSLPSPIAENGAPPPPPDDAMFALPRAPPRARARRTPGNSSTSSRGLHELSGDVPNAFNEELQTLLQSAHQRQQQDVIESVGGNDGEVVAPEFK